MRDFTLDTYQRLLATLHDAGYQGIAFEDYMTNHDRGKFVILRHDVDKLPLNSVATARIEREMGMRASYYFRIVPQSNNPTAIRDIAAMGHEIGYHYEDFSLTNGQAEKAWKHFCESLDYFRQYYPVRTACMHGAPTSKYDSRELWQTHDYHTAGIIGEPYYDADFDAMLYLTDTGRCWDGYKVSLRDKIPTHQNEWVKRGWSFHSTSDIMKRISILPDQIMMTTHPQRWTNNPLLWSKEFVLQTMKNCVKYYLAK